MGGSGGGFGSDDFRTIEERIKQSLAAAQGDGVRHVFISFDHDDLDKVTLLRGQAKNDRLELEFDDHSLRKPFDSADAEYIRAGIRERIARSSVTVVFLSDASATSKWVNWEIEESLRRGKGVVGVYQDTHPKSLPPAFKANRCKAVPWKLDQLQSAIEEASTKR